MKEVYIFRHGETDWNAQERFQGHIDVPLNDQGRAQARLLVPQLQRQGIETIVSSDLSRALETAEIVARALGVTLHSDIGLREAHLGEAQGMTREEIERRFGEELVTRWKSNRVSDADVSYPGGETGTEITRRVFCAMDAFLDSTTFERIGVATHGGVIRRVMQRLLPRGTPPVPIPNGVLYLLGRRKAGRAWRVELCMPLMRSDPMDAANR